MSAKDFEVSGLNKLSTEELKNLDNWLQIYTLRIVKKVNKMISPQYSNGEVIETCFDSDFEGWKGETIFKLCNGQIWQQSSYAYVYHYAYRPEVVIYKTSGGYKMKVEDLGEEIYVIKN